MTFIRQTRISCNHPSLPGHFPGHPVVPGVMLLEQIRLALYIWRPDCRLCGFSQVKFLQALLPEQTVQIELKENQGKIRFICRWEGSVIAQGELQLGPS